MEGVATTIFYSSVVWIYSVHYMYIPNYILNVSKELQKPLFCTGVYFGSMQLFLLYVILCLALLLAKTDKRCPGKLSQFSNLEIEEFPEEDLQWN